MGVNGTEGNNGILCRPLMAELMAYAALAAHKPGSPTPAPSDASAGSQAEAHTSEQAAVPAEAESNPGQAGIRGVAR